MSSATSVSGHRWTLVLVRGRTFFNSWLLFLLGQLDNLSLVDSVQNITLILPEWGFTNKIIAHLRLLRIVNHDLEQVEAIETTLASSYQSAWPSSGNVDLLSDRIMCE